MPRCSPSVGTSSAESQVYGDAPRLLFLEPVRIYPRKGLHERRLAVINVASRTENEPLLRHSWFPVGMSKSRRATDARNRKDWRALEPET